MAHANAICVVLETTPKKSFATAVDWPGWARGSRTPDAALASLLAYAPRYAAAIASTGLELPAAGLVAEVVEELAGNASTEYGVPGSVASVDRTPLPADEAARRAAIVAACWATFDRVAASAPEDLRKGPRGGGRDTSTIVRHVVEADAGYSPELGLRLPAPDPADRTAVEAFRAAELEVLRRPSDGSPIAKRWPARYAAQRIAWHALDHAWEIEDRSEP